MNEDYSLAHFKVKILVLERGNKFELVLKFRESI